MTFQWSSMTMSAWVCSGAPATRSKIKVSSNTGLSTSAPPQPQPDGFTGAVGSFSIDSRMVGNTFRTNDPATLIYTIKGNRQYPNTSKGLKLISPTESSGILPKATSDRSHGKVSGSMTVEYTFIT